MMNSSIIVWRQFSVSCQMLHRARRKSIRQFCTGKPLTDMEIHQSYTLAKKLEVLSTLLTTNGIKKFDKMRKSRVGLGASFARNLGLFIEIQHPLIKKYNLDFDEFMHGVEHAYMRVAAAIYSKDFARFALGEAETSSEADFLRGVCTPEAFNIYMDLARNGFGANPNYKIVGEKFTAFRLSLYKVNTAVVDESTPSALGDEEDVDGQSGTSRFFGASPPSFGVAAAGVGSGPAESGQKIDNDCEGKVPHFGDSLSLDEEQVDNSPRPNKSRSSTVALMDVNFLTDCEVEIDGAKSEDVKLSQIMQWRLLGYLSEGENLEWKISNCIRIWPPF